MLPGSIPGPCSELLAPAGHQVGQGDFFPGPRGWQEEKYCGDGSGDVQAALCVPGSAVLLPPPCEPTPSTSRVWWGAGAVGFSGCLFLFPSASSFTPCAVSDCGLRRKGDGSSCTKAGMTGGGEGPECYEWRDQKPLFSGWGLKFSSSSLW